MSEFPTASFTDLGNQAPEAVAGYLRCAIKSINEAFPTYDDDLDDYAERHPELVAEFIAACSREYIGSALLKGFGPTVASLVEALAWAPRK